LRPDNLPVGVSYKAHAGTPLYNTLSNTFFDWSCNHLPPIAQYPITPQKPESHLSQLNPLPSPFPFHLRLQPSNPSLLLLLPLPRPLLQPRFLARHCRPRLNRLPKGRYYLPHYMVYILGDAPAGRYGDDVASAERGRWIMDEEAGGVVEILRALASSFAFD